MPEQIAFDYDTEEQWRPIPGWEGYYEASDMGRIQSVERTARIRGGGTRTVPAQILKLRTSLRR
ncbi:NUMOD4 domain-containing protein [Mycolicibacterium gadium]|uniref:NUMOD4 domain-containing protein n=2 Tax=Mycolicibacterium gadium TaxID=1794 RepID=A0A7I7WKK1_MYCGU|nr:hypothetical protein MGAD_14160 [Mycolicibacterium gadium]